MHIICQSKEYQLKRNPEEKVCKSMIPKMWWIFDALLLVIIIIIIIAVILSSSSIFINVAGGKKTKAMNARTPWNKTTDYLHSPEQDEHSMRKCLKVVVPMDLCVVVQPDLTKHLSTHIHSINDACPHTGLLKHLSTHTLDWSNASTHRNKYTHTYWWICVSTHIHLRIKHLSTQIWLIKQLSAHT